MKLALYQGPVIDGATGEAFAKIREVLTAAAASGTRMALFPELFLPGYNHPEHHAALAQPQGGAWMTALSALARETGCGLTIGWAEAADGTVYNAATTIDASGALRGHYRKIQLYGPREAATLALDSSQARARLGWQPRWDLEQALEHTLAWHRAWRAGADMRVVTRRQIRDYRATA